MDFTMWALFLIIAFLLYFGSFMFKMPHLFALGCALLIGVGGLLFVTNGLTMDRQATTFNETTNTWSYTDVTIDSSNIGVFSVGLILVAIGVISVLIVNFNSEQKQNQRSVFHY